MSINIPPAAQTNSLSWDDTLALMNAWGDQEEPGRLILAGTPLGNLGDATPRLAQSLAEADIIAAEDTRRCRRLLAGLGVETSARIVSHYDANEQARLPSLLKALRDGADVVVVSDAGMPSISDPGYRLTAAAAEADIPVTVIPGPSAVMCALAVSGLPTDRFCFEGFPPRKPGKRRRLFASLAEENRTLVFFESPHRIAAVLVDLSDAFGQGRRAVVCRELTKVYEEVRRGSLVELAQWAAGGVKGEVTLVVEGAASRIK